MIRHLAAALLALSAGPALADIFSPGELAQPHAALEGLANCTKCHEAGNRLSEAHCLACHKEVQARIDRGRGLHGRIPAAERGCQACHHEHQGRGFKLVDWGPPGLRGFDHARAGWELKGKHKKAECARCHDPRLVKDPAVREVLVKGRPSFLGPPVACAGCHFDEHRGQLGPTGLDCQRCHVEESWKKVRFDHDRSAYRLTGRHARVACARCHKPEPVEPPGEVAPLTAPLHPQATVRLKPIRFAGCADCHKDPHQGRFGEGCTSCHTTADWKRVVGAGKEIAFHPKTRYPLEGAHVQVACAACHGGVGKARPRYRGVPFARCTDCHLDAHLGQLAASRDPRTCDRCHQLTGFVPVRFELEDHQKLEYRLEGAHRAVACAGCHPKDPRLERKVKAADRARLERERRKVTVSLALLDIKDAARTCQRCHRDPHGRQFQQRVEKQGCVGCHGVDGWRTVRLDHTKDTRYPLVGKHEKAACASCHRPDDGGVVRYRPLPLTCAQCHPDVHAGQLVVAGKGTDCARCHEAGGWKRPLLRFDHQRDSRFPLEGKHLPLACDKCHPVVRARGGDTARYKPLAVSCQGCHADFHKGAFRGFAP
jgi:hypothetical protein